jgi:hypothetical protein
MSEECDDNKHQDCPKILTWGWVCGCSCHEEDDYDIMGLEEFDKVQGS